MSNEKMIFEAGHKANEIRWEFEMKFKQLSADEINGILIHSIDLIIQDLKEWGCDDRDRERRVEFWEQVKLSFK